MAGRAYFRVTARRNRVGLLRYRWNLHAANGEIVATSEQYNSREAAQHGASVVQRMSPSAELQFRDYGYPS